jgi:geranylgeranyl pyrophosphate synthase
MQLYMSAGFFFDSLEDNDPITYFRSKFRMDELLNGATGTLILAYFFLNLFLREQNFNNQSLEIIQMSQRTLIRSCSGQARELRKNRLSLDQWWEIASAKTGEPYSLICFAGARFATNSKKKVTGLGKFGFHLGLIIQILDDSTDFLPNFDTKSEHPQSINIKSLPISYALEVLPPDQKNKLQNLIPRIDESSGVFDQILEILVGSGVSAYLEAALYKHYTLAKNAITSDIFRSPAQIELLTILDRLTHLGPNKIGGSL